MPAEPTSITVDLDNCPKPMDLQTLFPRSAPLHLEVGSGKGTFILHQARTHPENNYLGIEWANKIYKYAADRLRRWQVTNARMLRADAREFLAQYVPNACIEALHLYFPDPWPKKRHHKRRFVAPENLVEVHRILLPGKHFYCVTDHEDYAQVMREVIESKAIQALFEEVEFFVPDSAEPGEWVGTNFERKYRKEGRDFFPLALRKR